MSLWNGIQVMIFVSFTSVLDVFQKYVLTKDALIVILYSWVGVILRNWYYTQEVFDWSSGHSPLIDAKRASLLTTSNDGQVSLLSMVPIFKSAHFAMIVLIIFNKMNRHDNELVQDQGKPTMLKRILKLKYVFFDIQRCLLKDIILHFLVQGDNTNQSASRLLNDVKFVAIASVFVNHVVKAPNWYKRQGILWSIMIIEH